MKLSQLLHARAGLLRQTGLANLGYAYRVLADFSTRVARARLHGTVHLQTAAPAEGRYWPTLTALDFNQSLVEEHFSDDDIAALADTLAYLSASEDVDRTAPIADLVRDELAPLRARLARAGIEIDPPPATLREPSPNDTV